MKYPWQPLMIVTASQAQLEPAAVFTPPWIFYNPRANGAKRRSGRKPGARVLIPPGYFFYIREIHGMKSQPAPGSQLQVREPGAGSIFDLNLELE